MGHLLSWPSSIMVLYAFMMMCLLRRYALSLFCHSLITSLKHKSTFFFTFRCFSIQAQAIMLLAGNGSSATQNKPLPTALPTSIPTAQVPTSIHRPSIGDGYVRNNSHTTSPCSGLSSPISVTSHVVSQSAVGPSCSNDLAKVKPAGALASSNTQKEPSKAIGSVGAPAPSLIPAGILLSYT